MFFNANGLSATSLCTSGLSTSATSGVSAQGLQDSDNKTQSKWFTNLFSHQVSKEIQIVVV